MNRPFRCVLLAAVALAAALIAAAGCAKRLPPSGGPPDLEPPRVIGASPDSGAARVPLDATLSITFSEAMDERSTGDVVALAPRVDIRQRRWNGRTLTLTLAESLKARKTYALFLGAGARDRHGNNLENGANVVFSTADSFPPGLLEGEIEARGFAGAGTYLWCYAAAAGRVPDSTARDFDDIGLADKDSRFRIAGLPVPGRYRLWAFADLNANHSFEPATDILAQVDTVFELTPERPVARGLLVRVVNPRAPGKLKGSVVDTLNDSLGLVRLQVVSERDTTRTLIVETDGQHHFDVPLAPGTYRIRAYRDHDRNKLWQSSEEPGSERITVEIPPAGEVVDVRLVLKRPPVRP